MTNTATTTTYRATFSAGPLCGTVLVQAVDKDAAAVEAVRHLVRSAKAYNAKYDAQGLPTWARKNERAEDYRVSVVRKAAARRAR